MSQGQGGGQGDDNEAFKLLICALVCIFIIISLVYSQSEKINAFIGGVTWLHIWPFAMAVKYAPWLLDIPIVGSWLFGMSAAAHDFLLEGGFSQMTSENRMALLKAGGRAASIIYGATFLWVAFRGQDFRVDQKYRTLHNLESMIHVQSDIWMTSRMARHVNPLDRIEVDVARLAKAVASKLAGMKNSFGGAIPSGMVTLRPGTWSRSLRPEEWLVANGLAFDKVRYDEITSSARAPLSADFEFREAWQNISLESVSDVLAEQLRAPWRGVSKLRPCHRAIYAVMASFYGYDIDGGNRLLNDLGILAAANKASPGSMDKAILAEKGMIKRIDAICEGESGKQLAYLADQHAWVESAFPALIAAARKDRGVLPPAAFLWLKSEDRLMWYILNNVGNEAIMIEAAGALAHSRAELQIGKPIRRPAVYQAARALIEDYLDLTPERIKSRAEREERQRSPGTQMDIMAREIDLSEPEFVSWGESDTFGEEDV